MIKQNDSGVWVPVVYGGGKGRAEEGIDMPPGRVWNLPEGRLVML
jgi:hypothetical protein